MPTAISAALVGSCTNSSYEDIARRPRSPDEARALGLRGQDAAPRDPRFGADPCDHRTRRTPRRSRSPSAPRSSPTPVVRASVSGTASCVDPTDREHDRHQLQPQLREAQRRQRATKAFLASPEIVVALALAGTLDFDPVSDTIVMTRGEPVRLETPSGSVLPADGLHPGGATAHAAAADPGVVISVSPTSRRLQLLAPFPAWDGEDYVATAGAREGHGASARPTRSRPPVGG